MRKARNKIISGVSFDPVAHDLLCHLTLFRFAPKLSTDPLWRWPGAFDEEKPEAYCGLGRYEHAKAIDTMLWPTEFEYHRYSEEHTQGFCDHRETAITGGGGTSKSTSLAAYALKFHWCAPQISAVLIVSTTVEAAERRVWREILRLYYIAHRKLGNIYGTVPIRKPKPMIHMRDEEGNPDISHGLFVIAVAKGELDKGINSIKGYHVKRLLYGIDETDAVHQACVSVKANISIGCDEFQAVYLGNDPSLLNPFGQLMMPEKGKPVTLAHKQWTSYEGVYCLRSSAYDSPNIPEKKYQGIVSQTDIDEITRHGTRKNTAEAWIMLEGLHPPEGCDETVLSESMLFKYRCFEEVVWQRDFTESGSLDPGFGGDPCTLRFYKRGKDLQGNLRLMHGDRIEIPIEADRRDYPPENQIADKVKEQCKSRGIPPEEFIVGATGIGRGVGSALMRYWSPRINICEEGGACTDRIMSDEDPRPANEVCDRKVTELYFSIREFVEADLIRGMDTAYTALQLCNRKHELKGKKKSLESKRDMKERGQPSPNDSDCLAFYIDMLRSKGIHAEVKTDVKTKARKQLQDDFNSYEPNEEETYQDIVLDEEEVFFE